MNPSQFLSGLVKTVPEYRLTAEDQKKIRYEGVEAFIYSRLTSSKYKASALPEDFAQSVKTKIHLCVEDNLPIHITVPFGGYKKWQLPTAPHPDWAEVISIALIREYLSPIAAAYKNGVLLDYFSDEIFIPRMNNYPQKDINKYNRQFKKILDFFHSYLPPNLMLKYSQIRDFISQDEIINRFEVDFPKFIEEFGKLPKAEKDKKMAKTARNYQGDLSKLSKEERQKVLLDSYLCHEAFIRGDWDKDIPWAFDKDMVALGFCYTGSWGIHLRSSPSSTVQFWIGMGALRQTGDSYLPTILTYQQYKEEKNRIREESVKLFPEELTSLQKIPIIKA